MVLRKDSSYFKSYRPGVAQKRDAYEYVQVDDAQKLQMQTTMLVSIWQRRR